MANFVNKKDSKSVDAKRSYFFGQPGEGKTTLLAQKLREWEVAQDYFYANDLMDEPRRGLVVDYSRARGLKPFQPITIAQVIRSTYPKNHKLYYDWVSGVRRIRITFDKKELNDWGQFFASGDFCNALLAFDEFRNINNRTGEPPKWQTELITNCRNFPLDLWLVFHELTDPHVRFRKMMDRCYMLGVADVVTSPKWFVDRQYRGAFKMYDAYMKVSKSFDPTRRIQHYETVDIPPRPDLEKHKKGYKGYE